MYPFTPEQTELSRDTIYPGADRDLYLDVGFFITWFALVEISLTGLLFGVTRSSDLVTFDILCRGMDARVKIERLRKAAKRHEGIGPNLSARLTYFHDRAIPIRNSLAHGAFSSNEDDGPRRYFVSSLSSLPWKELGQEPPAQKSEPPKVITSHELHAWGLWFSLFKEDLRRVYAAGPNGMLEIDQPRSKVPPADRQPTGPQEPRAKKNKRGQTQKR